jgi:tRNA G18 (ribose-2'-O)-methylase SpoU
MGAVRRVARADDALLSEYVGLTDMALRSRREPAEGLFIAEGDKVIRRALDAGYAMRSMLLEEKWLPAMADVVEAVDAPVYLAEPAVLQAVTGYSVHRGALAAMARKPELDALELAAGARRIVVLEEVNNHTNIGAVLRCAAGLGVDAVLLDPRCADPLYRRSVKVSMGAVFAVPWARLAPWPDALGALRDLGFTLLALTPDAAATSLAELGPDLIARPALLLGAEGAGLSAEALAVADHRVRIPMAAGVDSLNVAAAAAVAFYALGAGAQDRR